MLYSKKAIPNPFDSAQGSAALEVATLPAVKKNPEIFVAIGTR